MEWLTRLVTPPGGTVLDMFAGSGTTGVAALKAGRNAVLVELDELNAGYIDIITGRIEQALRDYGNNNT
jgi:site-specific DNA-methyltransferase (adenine-specific)